MKKKLCPICKIEKPIEDYNRYFSSVRNKYLIGNYCKPCARKESNERSKKYYQDNKEKKLKYEKERKEWKLKDAQKHRDALSDRYVLMQLKQTLKGESSKDMRLFPEMIEAKRMQILTSRIIKKLRNGKK